MFDTLLKPVLHGIYPCSTEEIRANLQKEARIIDTLEPVLNQHRLIVDTTLVREDIAKAKTQGEGLVYSLFYQLTHITRDRGSLLHDDILDVLAMTVQQWQRVLVQDPKQALERHNRLQLEKEMGAMAARHKPQRQVAGFARHFRGSFRG